MATTTYFFPQRPPGLWESKLWPAAPVAPPAGFARKQEEQWGDNRLDVGAVRNVNGTWQVLTGAGWIPYNDTEHLGIARMYYRYSWHSYRGQVHQEPENQYIQLAQKDPTRWPLLPWITDRMPISPDERCLEDVGMDRSFRSRINSDWRREFQGDESAGGNEVVSESGVKVIPSSLTVEIDPKGSGSVDLELRVETNKVNVVSLDKAGFPTRVNTVISPTRIVGPGARKISFSWLSGVVSGTYDKPRLVISTGTGPENKIRIPLVFKVAEINQEEPMPTPQPKPSPTPAPSPSPSDKFSLTVEITGLDISLAKSESGVTTTCKVYLKKVV